MFRAGALALALGLSGLSTACSPPCDTADSDKTVTYSKGTVDPSETVYESSPWNGPYLHFPAGRRFSLEHHLKKTPSLVNTYLAFDERPLPGGNTSESAGNQAVIERVDDQVIVVRNDTCAEFWLRVVAIASPGGPSDAGAD